MDKLYTRDGGNSIYTYWSVTWHEDAKNVPTPGAGAPANRAPGTLDVDAPMPEADSDSTTP